MIHPLAVVERALSVPDSSRVWHWTHIMAGAVIGEQCNVGQGCFIDDGVVVGDRCKLQNGVMLYHGVTVEDGVFLGPNVVTTNDQHPRAITPGGSLKSAEDWEVRPTLIKYGASIGANATIRCGVTIGKWAMVGAGAVVTHDVPDHGLVRGCPDRLVGFVCSCGMELRRGTSVDEGVLFECPVCPLMTLITRHDYAELVL